MLLSAVLCHVTMISYLANRNSCLSELTALTFWQSTFPSHHEIHVYLSANNYQMAKIMKLQFVSIFFIRYSELLFSCQLKLFTTKVGYYWCMFYQNHFCFQAMSARKGKCSSEVSTKTDPSAGVNQQSNLEEICFFSVALTQCIAEKS